MILILVRHGETKENRQDVFQGHLDSELSDEGREQARRLGHRLAAEKIDFIYSSDLSRAAETAKEVAKYHPKAKVFFLADLRERHLGELEGKKKSEAGIANANGMSVDPKQGEPIPAFITRVEKFLKSSLEKHPEDTIVLVSHNNFTKVITGLIGKLSLEEMKKIPNLRNTSVSIFEMSGDGNHKMHLYDCIRHLD